MGVGSARMFHEYPIPNPAIQDSRQEVVFPPLVKRHTPMTMRTHLQGLGEIQETLPEGTFWLICFLGTCLWRSRFFRSAKSP